MKIDGKLALLLLTNIGKAVRTHLAERDNDPMDRAVVGYEGGDVTFGIDRNVHPVISDICRSFASQYGTIELVAEGFGVTGKITFSGPGEFCGHILIDPIDGTRGLMYDLRSAWFLAAWCDSGPVSPSAESAKAVVMMELPTSKQFQADALFFSEDTGVVGERHGIFDGSVRSIEVRPSSASDLLHGFGGISDFFFPGTGTLASELMSFIVERCAGALPPGSAYLFNDQYISSGGQLAELVFGRYRFCMDLRPIFYRIIEFRTGTSVAVGLQCHPYDLASIRIAIAAGVVVTDGYGKSLSVPFGIDQPMHWRGYANRHIQNLVEPIVNEWIQSNLS